MIVIIPHKVKNYEIYSSEINQLSVTLIAMKKILLLTDFSENAAHAAMLAYELCKKMQADLLLFHSYQVVPVTAFYGGGPYTGDPYSVLEEDSKKNLIRLADSVRVQSQSAASYQPWIGYQSCGGSLGQGIGNVLEKEDIELVVLGGPSGGLLDHLLNGSDTRSVIRHSNRPVLVVSGATKITELKKIMFATDFNTEDLAVISYLAELAGTLNLKLEVAHVSVNEEKEPEKTVTEIEFRKYINHSSYRDVQYHAIHGKEAAMRLNRLCKEAGADLLALVHFDHSLIDRLFRQSTTYKAIDGSQLSFLVFPSKFKNSN